MCHASLKQAAAGATSSEESQAVVEQRERAHEVLPSRRVGGMYDKQLEEDDSGVGMGACRKRSRRRSKG